MGGVGGERAGDEREFTNFVVVKHQVYLLLVDVKHHVHLLCGR